MQTVCEDDLGIPDAKTDVAKPLVDEYRGGLRAKLERALRVSLEIRVTQLPVPAVGTAYRF